MTGVRALTAEDAAAHTATLVALLQATVAAGASIGFHPPVSFADARAYWHGIVAGVAAGERVLIAAFDGERAVGSVQVALESRDNGRHRGEIQKLMVLPEARGRGLGSALMAAAEDAARRAGRTLLVLDTREGDTAERLYRRMGWTEAGRVPGYVREADGSHSATIYFYRQLDADS